MITLIGILVGLLVFVLILAECASGAAKPASAWQRCTRWIQRARSAS